MTENQSRDNSSSKCLCTYCSGSIAKGMLAMNNKNVAECNKLVDDYDNSHSINLDDLSSKLDYLNPVQCFDILDKLCEKCSSSSKNHELDELILKFLIRFRNNGGFFLALKQPIDHRKYLLQRITDTIVINKEYAEKVNLTFDDIHQ